MKEKKEVRNQVSKKGFVERYEEITQALKKAIIVIVYLIISFPLFTAGSYYVTWQLIGDGVYSYSEEAYDNIKTLLSYDIVAGVGIDTYHIINATEVTVKEIKGELEESSEAENSEADMQPIIDEYEITYENGVIIFICKKRIGKFFTAEVTQTMNANFNTIDTKRNYNTEADYMRDFQKLFAGCVIGGAVGVWIAFTVLVGCMLFIATRIIKYVKKEDEIEEAVNVCEESNKATEA